jgi:hypothetical protein
MPFLSFTATLSYFFSYFVFHNPHYCKLAHFSPFIGFSTERCGRAVNTPASYPKGPGLKCWPGDRLPGMRLFVPPGT